MRERLGFFRNLHPSDRLLHHLSRVLGRGFARDLSQDVIRVILERSSLLGAALPRRLSPRPHRARATTRGCILPLRTQRSLPRHQRTTIRPRPERARRRAGDDGASAQDPRRASFRHPSPASTLAPRPLLLAIDRSIPELTIHRRGRREQRRALRVPASPRPHDDRGVTHETPPRSMRGMGLSRPPSRARSTLHRRRRRPRSSTRAFERPTSRHGRARACLARICRSSRCVPLNGVTRARAVDPLRVTDHDSRIHETS